MKGFSPQLSALFTSYLPKGFPLPCIEIKLDKSTMCSMAVYKVSIVLIIDVSPLQFRRIYDVG